MVKDPDNLIWIDLEMTGLRPDVDHILEIATLVTDKQLNVLAEGPALAIHQPQPVLDLIADAAEKWCSETQWRMKIGSVRDVGLGSE